MPAKTKPRKKNAKAVVLPGSAGYFTLDERGLITEVNKAGAELLCLDESALIGRNFSRYIAAEHQTDFHIHHQLVLEKMRLQTCELKISGRNGQAYFVRLHSNAIVNAATGKKQILAFITDITDRKRAKDSFLVHQFTLDGDERKNFLNEFASSMADELKHPLAVISNFLHGSKKRLSSRKFDVKEIMHAIDQSIEQCQRAVDTIERMKHIGDINKMLFDSVNINDVINSALAAMQYEIADYPVRISRRLARHLPEIMGDRIRLEQVIISLVRNAIEAMRDAGTEEPKLGIETRAVIDAVEISFFDNGPGIPDTSMHKLFNPHFTTKTYGLGQGLAICRKIIEAHGGRISGENNPAYGSCFKFTLPVNKR